MKDKGQGTGFVVVLLVIIAIALIVIALKPSTNPSTTGNTINTYVTKQSNQVTEQVIIDEEQQIKEGMYYITTFEIFKPAKVSVDLSSNELVNFALLPDYEVEHYTKGESYKSFANLEMMLSLQENYNLNAGKYSIVLTSIDSPVDLHLIVKVIEL